MAKHVMFKKEGIQYEVCLHEEKLTIEAHVTQNKIYKVWSRSFNKTNRFPWLGDDAKLPLDVAYELFLSFAGLELKVPFANRVGVIFPSPVENGPLLLTITIDVPYATQRIGILLPRQPLSREEALQMRQNTLEDRVSKIEAHLAEIEGTKVNAEGHATLEERVSRLEKSVGPF